MASGAGFQVDAIKNLKDNRGLLKKTEAFDNIRQNKFINAPEMKIDIPKGFYHNLSGVKAERAKKENKIKQVLIIIVSTIIALIMMGLMYLNSK